MTPLRLRLSRAKGFDLQAHSRAINGLPAVHVARPTKWGNPFTIRLAIEAGFLRRADEALAADFVVECFTDWLFDKPEQMWIWPFGDAARTQILLNVADLRGKNLACWCKPDAPCHADVLLELANGPACQEVRP